MTASIVPARPVLHLAPRPSPDATDPVLSSTDLLKGEREILIRHGESLYRLRHTHSGKLILTK